MTETTTEFKRLDESTIPNYILSDIVPKEVRDILGVTEESQITSQEVGDGNLNYVFIIRGPSGTVILKQAIPYIRCIGESWPLTRNRAFYESSAMEIAYHSTPSFVPKVYFYDKEKTLTIMQYLDPPHIILRKGLLQEILYPKLEESLSDYLAKSLFSSSSFALTSSSKKSLQVLFNANYELCQVTEKVVFTDPYTISPLNRWTSPQLDDIAKELRENGDIKMAIADLKLKFQDEAQAIIHGDLHTGSIMVTEETMYIFDYEFAFMGPMAFDLGALLANLFLAYFSKDGHITATEAYKRWILELIMGVWIKFQAKFIQLWNTEHKGDTMSPSFFGNVEALEKCQKNFMNRLYFDTLGFMSAKIIRRIVGVAHVEDMESINDADLRSKCERRAIEFAIEMLLNRTKYATIQDVVNYAINK